jgi:hypothetical protein
MILVWSTNIEEKLLSRKFRSLKLLYFFSIPDLKDGKNKKGEGRFSFTFLRREISPACLLAVLPALL